MEHSFSKVRCSSAAFLLAAGITLAACGDDGGGTTPTPDQGNVDDIGRAYGVQEEDSGELRTSTEVMERRDHRRRGLSVPRGRP